MKQNQNSITSDLFIKHLKEFVEAPLTKFSEDKKLRFEDGTYMLVWYKKYNKLIKEYDVALFEKLNEERLQYKDMLLLEKLETDEILLKKLEYFKNYDNVCKFYYDFKSVDDLLPKFEDIDNMSLIWFWRYYKKYIEISNLPICKEIMEQYKDMIINKPKNSNNYRFREFIEEDNLLKFSKTGHLKFNDGYSMYGFWANNFKTLLRDSAKVRVEFRKFQQLKKNEEEKTKDAVESLKESKALRRNYSGFFTKKTLDRLKKFVNLENDKFNENGKGTLLYDNISAYDFWISIKTPLKKVYNLYKDKQEISLLEREKLSIIIYKQYEEYLLEKKLSSYEKEQSEFESLSCRKFISTADTKLSSGKNVYDWWMENKSKLYDESLDNEISSNIVNQYERFVEMTYGISYREAYSDDNLDEIDNWCLDMGYIKKL